MLIKPRPLKKGSKIAIISPSSACPHLFPGIYELGLRNLKELLGFQIVEYPTARMTPEELYYHPEQRARDINNAFADDEIDGIICSIGGYESVRILDYLDMDTILANPKLIMGFSDTNTFLHYLNAHGLVTFYGPSVMAGFAQLAHIEGDYLQHLQEMLYKPDIPYLYRPYSKWSHGYKSWTVEETFGHCTEFLPNERPLDFLQKGNKEIAEGRLWGGCVEVLEFLKGTKYWPEPSFFDDKILFFETTEDKPTPFLVSCMIRNYGTMGVLERVKGIIFGRPKDYSDEECIQLKELIKNIIEIEYKAPDIPVIMDADFGHTEPKWILPIGCKVHINTVEETLSLQEQPFQ